MTRTDLKKRISRIFDEATILIELKGEDYASEEDALENFTHGKLIGISTKTAIMARLLDKFVRLQKFYNQHDLSYKKEAVADTILDAINYLAILLAVIRENDKDQSRDQSTDSISG